MEERIGEIERLSFWLQSRLSVCGLSGVRLASPAELSANMRIAFNPGLRDVVMNAMLKGEQPLRWSQAGPLDAEEHRNHYTHDQAASISWAWRDGPRSPVPATVLAPLVNPGPYPKRLTLMWEPSDPGQSAGQLEREKTLMDAKRILLNQSPGNESQRQRLDREFAERAAQEEAMGAGFGDLSMYLTVTVPHESLLDDAALDIKTRASQAKVHLRRATCSHSAVFATGLGAGIHPGYKSFGGWF